MERWLVSHAMDGLPTRPLSLECCNLYYLMPLCLTKPPRKQLMITFMTAFLKLDTDFRNTIGKVVDIVYWGSLINLLENCKNCILRENYADH
jgi:hypothetical protein